MRWLSDSALDRLRDAADWPDLSGTKYEVVERVGRGGMGTVYLARDVELGREVALKVLSAPDATPQALARMTREAQTLARLEHPGIVPVHDVGTLPDGRVYYVMKLVRGARLDEYARGPRPMAELLRAFERICEAVGFAHARGVIHRDLKPENVMVGPFGEVLVMDWGVAKVSGERAPEGEAACAAEAAAPGATISAAPEGTAHGTVLGTPAYMAPEQACGAVDQIDPRTDTYALGGILSFLLTRSAPAPPAAPGATATSPRRIDPSIPRPLEAIVVKAVSADPRQRYQSAKSLSADVAAFLAGLPVAAYPEGPIRRAWRVAVKYRVPILLVLAYLVMRVVLLLAAGG